MAGDTSDSWDKEAVSVPVSVPVSVSVSEPDYVKRLQCERR